MKLTQAEYDFLKNLSAEDRELLLFLETRVVNTRGFFGVEGLSPRPNMSLAAPGFTARQLTHAEFTTTKVWAHLRLISLWEVSPRSAVYQIPARLGMTYRVEFTKSAWRVTWSLRYGKAYANLTQQHSAPL